MFYFFCRSIVEQLNKENERLKKDAEDLMRKRESLEIKLQEQSEEYGQLKSKYQQAITEHTESVRSLKVVFFLFIYLMYKNNFMFDLTVMTLFLVLFRGHKIAPFTFNPMRK